LTTWTSNTWRRRITAQIHALLPQRFYPAIVATGRSRLWRRRAFLILMDVIFGGIEQFAPAIIIETLVGLDLLVLIFLIVIACTQGLFFGRMLGFLAEQRFAILLGDLIIIGVDFREGEEAMTVAAIIDERRLQRRLDPRNLG
jgi:hypothetical protein